MRWTGASSPSPYFVGGEAQGKPASPDRDMYIDRFGVSLRATQVLYADGELAGSTWLDVVSPPAAGESIAVTSIWLYHDKGSDVEVRLRYTPPGETPGDKYIFFVQIIEGTDSWQLIENDIIVQAGGILAIYTDSDAVLNVKIDGCLLETR
jgi:hypothetical protein